MNDPSHRSKASLPHTAVELIDQVCDRFEAAWKAGQQPRIEDYLKEPQGPERSVLLYELLLLELDYRTREGDTPAPREYHSRFPEYVELIDAVFHEVGTPTAPVDDFKQHDVNGTAPHGQGLHIRCPHCHNPVEIVVDSPLTDIVCSSCGSHFSLVRDQTSTREAAAVTTIGRFELIERFGTGAFGTVWKARDTELDRTVAIKIPRKGQLNPREVEQFLREARAIAQLKHPNVVSIHEVGREGDTVYIVSDIVRGVSLDDWLTARRLSAREAAELCKTIAEVLHHAHEAGVIHRDLKPANIVIDADGRPHIMDFGLARRETGEITMTVDGQVLGTPAYMSPEQAQGEAHHADRGSDVYSLGVILFELLTGELPFRGNTRMLLHQVINDDAPSPRRFNSSIPKDLETICLKCLEKDPRKRYPTAEELADELGRHLKGEAIRARPIGRVQRAWRWCKRKPVVAGLGATVAVLVLFVAVASPLVALRQGALREVADTRALEARLAQEDAQQRRQQAETAGYQAQTKALQAYESLAASYHSQAQVLWIAKQVERQRQAFDFLRRAGQLRSQAEDVLEDLVEDPEQWGQRTQRFWETHFPKLRSEAARWSLETSLLPISTLSLQQSSRGSDYLLALSPDGQWLAYYEHVLFSRTRPETIQFVNPLTGKMQYRFEVGGRGYCARVIAFTPEGSQLLEGRVVECKGPDRLDIRKHWIPSGETIKTVSLSLPEGVEFWSSRTRMVFSPDLQRLLVYCEGQISGVWDVEDGSQIGAFDPEFRPQAFTRSGDQVVGFGGSDGREIQFRNVGTGEVTKHFPLGPLLSPLDRLLQSEGDSDRAEVRQLCLSRDGKWLAMVVSRKSRDWRGGWLVILDGETGANRKTAPLKRAHAYDSGPLLAFSADSRLLVTLTSEQLLLISLRDLSVLARQRHPEGSSEALNLATWSPGGVCFTNTGTQLATLLLHKRDVSDPPGANVIHVWELARPLVESMSYSHEASINSVHFDSAGRFLAAGGKDRKVRAWGRQEKPNWLAGYARERRLYWPVGFDPTGHVLITRLPDYLQLWDAATGQFRKAFKTDQCVATSPDRRHLAVKDVDAQGKEVVRVFDVATNNWVATFPWRHVSPESSPFWQYATFSPNGRFLLAKCSSPKSGGGFYVGDVSEQRTVTDMSATPDVFDLGFLLDPAGKTVLVSLNLRWGTSEGTLRLLELSTGRQLAEFQGLVPDASLLEDQNDQEGAWFSPDGNQVVFVAVAEDTREQPNPYILYLWSFDQAKPIRLDSAWENPILAGTTFAAEGTRLIVSGERIQGKDEGSEDITELWDLSQPRLIASRRGRTFCEDWLNEQHGTLLVDCTVDSNEPRCQIWDVVTGKVIAEHPGEHDWLYPGDEFLVMAIEGDNQQLIDISDGKVHMSVDSSNRLHFSPDDRTMIEADNSNLSVYDLASRAKWAVLEGQRYVRFSPDSKLLFTLQPRGETAIKVWDVTTAKLQKTIPTHFGNYVPSEIGEEFYRLTLSNDGKRLAIHVHDQIRLADLEAGKIHAVLPRAGHYDSVRAVDVSPDGKIVASASDDRTICLWQSQDGRFITMLEGYRDPIDTVRFSPDGGRLLSRDRRGQLRMWKLERSSRDEQLSVDASLLWQTQEPGQPLGAASSVGRSSSAAFSPDGKLVAGGSEEGSIELRDASMGKLVRSLVVPSGAGAVRSVAFRSHGKVFASGSADGTVRLWDPASGTLIRQWAADQGEIRALEFSPDGDILATAGNDVRLWAPRTGQMLLVLEKHSQPVNALSFNADGQLLATGSDDATVVVCSVAQLRERLAEMGLGW